MSYNIQKGDTLSGIAKAHGTTVDALMKANSSIKNADKIYAGNSLTIPSTEPKTNKSSDSVAGSKATHYKNRAKAADAALADKKSNNISNLFNKVDTGKMEQARINRLEAYDKDPNTDLTGSLKDWISKPKDNMVDEDMGNAPKEGTVAAAKLNHSMKRFEEKSRKEEEKKKKEKQVQQEAKKRANESIKNKTQLSDYGSFDFDNQDTDSELFNKYGGA